jgi:hypothetical protein
VAVESVDSCGHGGQSARESAATAADVKGTVAAGWQRLQQELVVVSVVVPAALGIVNHDASQ